MTRWTLHVGDAREVIGTAVPAGSVDLAYLDPPYGTGEIWRGQAGSFSDAFAWSAATDRALGRLGEQRPLLPVMLRACTQQDARRAYLVEMAELFLAVHGALADHGAMFVQADDTSVHYLGVVLDIVFGPRRRIGQIVWKRTTAHGGNTRSFGRVHDTIVAFQKRSHLRRGRRRYGYWPDDHGLRPYRGDHFDAVIEDVLLNPQSAERVGYPTQKPLALLERLIASASIAGDTVLDPCCGSGTTLVAARKLGRHAIGIDRNPEAVEIARMRLRPTERVAKRPSQSAEPMQAGLFA